ncbi:MBL fold metallo-hydrolase [Candidatus Dojkabacteria bacterium]|jgi:competence protein ComEC|nr:MBL fold metallo-hydrolase [Candidatus Dojkabacteria bacterium]
MKNTTTILKILKELLFRNILNILFFLLAIFFVVVLKKTEIGQVEVVFLNVGQGDAILIQQGNYQILVDGGADDTVLYELAKYLPWYDKTIEKVVLTHPHADHINGLLLVLKKYTVGEVYYNPVEYPNLAYEYLKDTYNDILVEIKSGDVLEYEDIYGVVLYPFEGEKIQEKNVNNSSVVMLFVLNGYKVLLMGDAEAELEEKLLDYTFLEGIDILKAGHHCSRTSSSISFLSFTQPVVAICMCGIGNSLGHPHYETLEKFEKMNVQYFVTYRDGNIRFRF